jgi:hypothetical protein
MAVIYYTMVTQGIPFNPQASEVQLQKNRDAVLRKIKKSIKELNLTNEELELLAA